MGTSVLPIDMQLEADAFIGRHSGEPVCIEGVTEIPDAAVDRDFIEDYRATFINDPYDYYSRGAWSAFTRIGTYVSQFLSPKTARIWFEGVYEQCSDPTTSVLCDNFPYRHYRESKPSKSTETPILSSPRLGMFLAAIVVIGEKKPALAKDLMALALEDKIVVVTGKQYPHPAYVDPNAPEFKKILLMDYAFEGKLGSESTVVEEGSNRAAISPPTWKSKLGALLSQPANSKNAGSHVQRADVNRLKIKYGTMNDDTEALTEEGKIALLAKHLVHEHRHIGQYQGQVHVRHPFPERRAGSDDISPFEMSAMLYLWKESLRTIGIELQGISYWEVADMEGIRSVFGDVLDATEKDAMDYSNCILEDRDCDKLNDSKTYLQTT